MQVGWVYSPGFLDHLTGSTHPDQPARLLWIREELERQGLLPQLVPIECVPAPRHWITQVHDPAYVDLAEMICAEGMPYIGSEDTPVCRDSFHVACLAAGAVIAACDAILEGTVQRAFCAVRPPGHHAEQDRAMGFCILNNIAIGATYLLKKHGLERLAILDWDVHHGNATQHMFETRPEVLFISLHQYPALCFPQSGYEQEVGAGAGEGFTLNQTLLPGQGDADYRRLFDSRVLPALDRFRPEMVLISAGFDACREDNLAHINLEPESFQWMTREVVQVANRHAGGRVLSVLEGGYHPIALPRSVAFHIAELLA